MTGRRFEGKVALVTGGNSGIGLAVATALVNEGAKVVLSGRNEATVAAAVKALGPSATGVAADTGRIDGIERVVAAVREFGGGRLDVLFCNAGVGAFGPIATISEQKWDEVMGVNVKGVYFTVQKALPLMSKGGAIVLNASVAAGKGDPGGPSTPPARQRCARRRSLGAAGRGGRPRQRRQPRADRDADLRQGRHEQHEVARPQGRLVRPATR